MKLFKTQFDFLPRPAKTKIPGNHFQYLSNFGTQSVKTFSACIFIFTMSVIIFSSNFCCLIECAFGFRLFTPKYQN
ncbi:MAG: hypothetical protein BGN92_00835 [Sphingobacteriales bacterium 41-5]|nr:MAG: hypothetical protein BGN92_00835 [Sphingobacteriales bacterium 41-5]